MEIKNCTPVLFADNARSLRDFYVERLGMTEVMNCGDMNYMFAEGFAIWQPDPQNIIPRHLGMDRITDAGATSRFELCFETGDIDAVYGALRAAGVRFLHEMNTEIWGQRTVRFYDPAGHLVEVGEAMHVFLRRIFEQEGRDLETTARRTFMTVDALKSFLE
jgi:catechol 2,3-dioxygenase-like lactoylglutathione lyase family enzyme